MHLYVQSSTIQSSQDMEAAYMSIDRGMDMAQRWYIHTVKYYSAIKMKQCICGNTDAPRDDHTK